MPETAVAERHDATMRSAPVETEDHSSHHIVTTGSEPIAYRAKVGRLVLHDGKEELTAKVALFYTAYMRDDSSDQADRPLIFCWNGGPGSSTIWLHMLSYGPRRLVFEQDPLVNASRWELANNGQSLLDVADLVFVDPPSTGFSRMAPGEDPEQFQEVDADAAVMGDFVMEFVTRERRSRHPIVLLGESYGTLRAPAVAEHLQNAHHFCVDGVILVSSILDVASVSFGVGSVLGPAGVLPSYTATAWHHGLIPGELEPLLARAEEFALGEYVGALVKGARLTQDEQTRIAQQLAQLTGLPADLCLASNLRVDIWRFTKALLRDRRRTVGRLDTRWLGIDVDPVGEAHEDDPSISHIAGPVTAAFNYYVREDLGWPDQAGLTYRNIIDGAKWKPRKSVEAGIWTPQIETASCLRRVMNKAPQLKVLLQSGIYDLGTPYLPAELTFDHLHLDPERRANVTMKRYEAGHMIYLHEASLAQMRADTLAFLATLRSSALA